MNLSNAQLQVTEFHIKAKSTTNETPTIPPKEIQELRLRLIAEEYQELKEAFLKSDIIGAADAIGDLLYVVIGTGVSCGLPLKEIFDEIHKSNMTKFIDGYRREDGKWIKGKSYKSPELGVFCKAN